MLRGACHGEAQAIEAIAEYLADAIILEARMQLRDRRIWSGQSDRMLLRSMLKRQIRGLTSQPASPARSRELSRLAKRLIENKARHYLARSEASSTES
jgi:hypothetical protein